MSDQTPDNPNAKLERLLRQWGADEAIDGLDVPEMPPRDGREWRPLRFVLRWLPPAASAAMLVVSSALFYNAWRMTATDGDIQRRVSSAQPGSEPHDGRRRADGIPADPLGGKASRPGPAGGLEPTSNEDRFRNSAIADGSGAPGDARPSTSPGDLQRDGPAGRLRRRRGIEYGASPPEPPADQTDGSPDADPPARAMSETLPRGKMADRLSGSDVVDAPNCLTAGRGLKDASLARGGEDRELPEGFRAMLEERDRRIARLRERLEDRGGAEHARPPGGAGAGVESAEGVAEESRGGLAMDADVSPSPPTPDAPVEGVAKATNADEGASPQEDRPGELEATVARLRQRVEQLEGKVVEREAALARAKRDHAEKIEQLGRSAGRGRERQPALAPRRGVGDPTQRVEALERLLARHTAGLQGVYLAMQAPLKRGIEARAAAARAARLADRCRQLAKVAETGDLRSLLGGLEVVLLRLDMLDVSDRSAVARFRRSAWTDELARRVRKELLAADTAETVTLLAEVRMVLWGVDDVD